MKVCIREKIERALERAQTPNRGPSLVSASPTPWAVICAGHGRMFLTQRGYELALWDDVFWDCPVCGEHGQFDWDNFRAWYRDHGPWKRRVYIPPGSSLVAAVRLACRRNGTAGRE
jgi:phage terminase large subunit GpA-like protein